MERPEYRVHPFPEKGPRLAGEKGRYSRALDMTVSKAPVIQEIADMMPSTRP